MVAFYTALISSIFVSNSILSGFKGMCSYLGISKNRTAAFGMGCALTFVCVISGLICWGLGFLLRALDIYFMFTIVAILVIASLVQFVELVIKKFVPSLYKSLGIYLPLITTNCVVLGWFNCYTSRIWYSFRNCHWCSSWLFLSYYAL